MGKGWHLPPGSMSVSGGKERKAREGWKEGRASRPLEIIQRALMIIGLYYFLYAILIKMYRALTVLKTVAWFSAEKLKYQLEAIVSLQQSQARIRIMLGNELMVYRVGLARLRFGRYRGHATGQSTEWKAEVSTV
jgi:hypothetical protein